MEKKRVIIDYNNITPELLALLLDKHPEGFDPGVMITYTNSKGELVRSVPLETHDTKYLFKISVELQNRVDRYLGDLDALAATTPTEALVGEDDESSEEEAVEGDMASAENDADEEE